MEFIIEHWSTIVGVLVIIAGAIVSIIKFVKSGKAVQLANIEEWLVYATAIAEKELETLKSVFRTEISKMDNPEYRDILTKRYLEFKYWNIIAA